MLRQLFLVYTFCFDAHPFSTLLKSLHICQAIERHCMVLHCSSHASRIRGVIIFILYGWCYQTFIVCKSIIYIREAHGLAFHYNLSITIFIHCVNAVRCFRSQIWPLIVVLYFCHKPCHTREIKVWRITFNGLDQRM